MTAAPDGSTPDGTPDGNTPGGGTPGSTPGGTPGEGSPGGTPRGGTPGGGTPDRDSPGGTLGDRTLDGTPEGGMPLGAALTQLAAAAPDRPAVTCDGVTLTRAELEHRANRLARAYRDLGVTAGDLVTIALPNGVEHYVSVFAVWKLGAVPQPVSPVLPAAERQAIIDLADPVLVVGVDPGAVPERRSVPPGHAPEPSTSGEPLPETPIPPAWKAMTSGGSTGRPKLIVAGDPGVVNARAALTLRIRPGGVQLVPGPLYHNGPFVTSMTGLVAGQHLVVLPRFDAVEALAAVERHRVDFVSLVPTMMLRMVRVLDEDPDRFDLSSLRVVWHMAAPCPEWLKERWIELVGPDRLFELYSGTENQAVTTITGREWLAHRGSVGRPVLGEIVVLDESGTPVRPQVVGEVFMRRGEGAPPAYRYVGAEARRHDGWESLGDLGWFDEDGYLYLCDRRTDLILSGGANVYPAEVEAVLLEHPGVESCAVVGLPDDDLGQRVHAVVQVRSAGVDEDDLQRFLADRLVRYKRPRSLRLVREPLRDDAGKVRRRALAESEAARLGRTSAPPPS